MQPADKQPEQAREAKKRRLAKQSRQAQEVEQKQSGKDEKDDEMEEKYPDTATAYDYDPDDGGTVLMLLPKRLVSSNAALSLEYRRRLIDVQEAGGYLSLGSYRKLCALMDVDVTDLESSGRDWESEIAAVGDLEVKVVLSDADIPNTNDDDTSDSTTHNHP